MTKVSELINLDNQVKQRYRSIATRFQGESTEACCSTETKQAHTDASGVCCAEPSVGASCCTPLSAEQKDQTTELCCLPAEEPSELSNREELSLGCDLRLLDIADPQLGEVVVDMGSGPGTDARKVANLVGEDGKVIGIDFLEEMIELARNQSKGYKNVEFIQSDIRSLILKDKMVDLIISNCVFNLVEDKEQVFKEAYRILKPGGRIVISDMITNDPDAQITADDYCACIGGASSVEEYKEIMTKVGFVDISSTKEYESQFSGALQTIAFESVIFKGYRPQ